MKLRTRTALSCPDNPKLANSVYINKYNNIMVLASLRITNLKFKFKDDNLII